MKVYRKSFKVSEHFPVERGQEWHVKQGNRIAEFWRVLSASKFGFEAEICEYFPE